ncbi:MAG: nickel-responsive transcriptional regulator NikR [Candidatus Hydrogenedentes bacterium]|nr:nickel-responsive transcriptional regulator NikR [Candidatus Hydrogenedentota bacterium]
MSSDLVRMSFTIDKGLMRRMERLLRGGRHGNRSEFIRDLIRARLVEEEWKADEEAVGTITLVYNHEVRQLADKLTSLQHEHHHDVLATTHVHLDRHICAEMIMVKGRPRIIEEMTEQLRQQKGVLHAAVSMGSTGKRLT